MNETIKFYFCCLTLTNVKSKASPFNWMERPPASDYPSIQPGRREDEADVQSEGSVVDDPSAPGNIS